MKDVENWLKSVSAFANGTGGVLVFGETADGTVAGVKDMETASEIIRVKIEEYIIPLPEVELKIQKAENGRRMLLLEVAAGQETPYYYIGEDTAAAYVRAAKASVPAGPQELKRLLLKGRHISYDTQITGYEAKNHTFGDFSVAYQEWTGNLMDDRRFESFGMKKGGKLTAAGLLFADDPPSEHSRISCRRWADVKEKRSGELLDSEEHTGGLIHLLNKGIWFIKRNMKVLWAEEEGRKKELADYHDGSMFEALVNAFAHRDYFVSGSGIRIDMYEDCLIICSPGGMPDGSSIQDKKTEMILPVRRNPVLADIFCQIGYMKLSGTGISEIEKDCGEFFSDKGQFTVILKNLNYKNEDAVTEEEIHEEQAAHSGDSSADNRAGVRHNGGDGSNGDRSGGNAGEKADGDIGGSADDDHDGNTDGIMLNENERKVLAILIKEPAVSTDNISQQSRIAKRTVERILQALKKKGAVVREGSRRSGSWRVLIKDRI